MIRNILAVIAGLIVGMVVNMALVTLNAYVLFPMPPGTNMQDPEQLNAYMATLPTAAFFVVLAAHLGQSFVGGWTGWPAGWRSSSEWPPSGNGIVFNSLQTAARRVGLTDHPP